MRVNAKHFETVYGKIDAYANQFKAEGIPAFINFTNEPDIEDDEIELKDGWSMQVGPYGLAINLWDEIDQSSRSWDLSSANPVAEALAIMKENTQTVH